jgi:hypothetical protein
MKLTGVYYSTVASRKAFTYAVRIQAASLFWLAVYKNLFCLICHNDTITAFLFGLVKRQVSAIHEDIKIIAERISGDSGTESDPESFIIIFEGNTFKILA